MRSYLQIIEVLCHVLLLADTGEGAQCTGEPRRSHYCLMFRSMHWFTSLSLSRQNITESKGITWPWLKFSTAGNLRFPFTARTCHWTQSKTWKRQHSRMRLVTLRKQNFVTVSYSIRNRASLLSYTFIRLICRWVRVPSLLNCKLNNN